MPADTCEECQARSLRQLPSEVEAASRTKDALEAHRKFARIEHNVEEQVRIEANRRLQQGTEVLPPGMFSIDRTAIAVEFVDTSEGPGLSGPMGGQPLLNISLHQTRGDSTALYVEKAKAVDRVITASLRNAGGERVPTLVTAGGEHLLTWDANNQAYIWDITW